MRPAIFTLLALAAPLFLAAPAAAQPVQPLDRLLPEIRRTHPGQFYDADGPHPGAGGSQHYHLKWMTPDGRIVWYDTDARTGRVLGASPGRDGFDARGAYEGRVYGPPPDAREQDRRAPPHANFGEGGREYDREYESGRFGNRGYEQRSFGGRGFGGQGYGGRGGYERGGREHGGGGR